MTVWIGAEIALVAKWWNRENLTAGQIAQRLRVEIGLCRSRSSVLGMINRHRNRFDTRRDAIEWSAAEVALACDLLTETTLTHAEVAARLTREFERHRSREAVDMFVYKNRLRLGIPRRRPGRKPVARPA